MTTKKSPAELKEELNDKPCIGEVIIAPDSFNCILGYPWYCNKKIVCESKHTGKEIKY